MDRIGQEVPGFEVSDVGLKVKFGSESRLYSPSPDKQILTCTNCNRPERWVKADPKKDLSDRHYARQMAGNPGLPCQNLDCTAGFSRRLSLRFFEVVLMLQAAWTLVTRSKR